MIGMPERLATVTSCWAQPRTCTTEPGGEPSDGSCTVWIESMTTKSGLMSSIAASTWGSAVSACSHRFGAHGIESFGPQPHLLGALLGGDVQRLTRPSRQQLQQQRALADARLAAEQRDRAGHHATAEHTIELAEPGGDRLADQRIDVGDRCRRGAGGRCDDRHVGESDLFDEGVPLPARRALTRPLGVRRAAVGADVFDPGLGHDLHHDRGVWHHRSCRPQWRCA